MALPDDALRFTDTSDAVLRLAVVQLGQELADFVDASEVLAGIIEELLIGR